MDSKRVILALVLAFAVFFAWQFLFPPQTPPPAQQTEAAQAQPEAPAAPAAPEAPAAPAPLAPAEGIVPTQGHPVTITTPLYTAVFSTQGGRLESLKLTHYNETLAGAAGTTTPEKVELVKGDPTLTLLLDEHSTWENAQWNENVADLALTEGAGAVTFTGRAGNFQIERVFTFHADTYRLDEKVRITNLGPGEDVTLTLRTASAALAGTSSRFNKPQVATYGASGLDEHDSHDKLVEKGVGPVTGLTWGAMDNNYFALTMLPASQQTTFTGGAVAETLWLAFSQNLGNLGTNQPQTADYSYYFGPMERDALAFASPALSNAVNFGWFDIIAKPLLIFLVWIHNNVVSNYGVAIILLTVIIKALFWPLSQKSYKSMEQMKKLQPMIMKLREKHKDDKQALNQATMQLYKTYKVNPASGCLPMVVQIPVFFGLYKALLEGLELRQAGFIDFVPFTHLPWLADLSQPDPYYVTPVIMGITMFFQQRMSPSTGDPMQRKLMMALPIVFTFMFLGFPSGLVVYWLVNNILSIAQQWLLMARNKKAKTA
ncbi:MAG: membrane protein insertase YidC [Desulfovibrionaceae bacterium]